MTVADGTLVWTAGLGGSQLYNSYPAIIDGDVVHLPGPTDVVTVERGDGTRRWSTPGHAPLRSEDGLWLIRGEAPDASDRSLVQVDPATGETIGELAPPIDTPQQLIDLGGRNVGVVSRTEMAVIDGGGQVLARYTWRAPLLDLVLFDAGVLFASSTDEAVTAVSVGTSTPVETTDDPSIFLDIFSGLPNPEWPLADDELRTLNEAIADLEERPAGTVLRDGLGFRGAGITYAAEDEADGHGVFIRGDHVVVYSPDGTKEVLDDPGGTVLRLAAAIIATRTDDPRFLDVLRPWLE